MRLEDFVRNFATQGEKFVENVVKDVRDRAASEVYTAIVDNSPVVTGAYRARHQVAVGSSEGSLIYAHPSIPPIEGLPSIAPTLPAPDVIQAEEAIKTVEPYERIVVFNDIGYAREIEYGSEGTDPYLLYEGVHDDIDNEIEDYFRAAFAEHLRNLR